MMNPKVDFYFTKAKQWSEEIKTLRSIILDCDLTEDLKWGCPCYTFGKSNIVLIHTFKEYCALLFFKGALLKDSKKILTQQTDNVQSARQMRFTNLSQIVKLKTPIKAYVYEAVKVEESGLKIEKKATKDYAIPDELTQKFKEIPALKKAFDALTPGRQRGYLLHFAAAKQSATRTARIEKAMPAIYDGKGLMD